MPNGDPITLDEFVRNMAERPPVELSLDSFVEKMAADERALIKSQEMFGTIGPIPTEDTPFWPTLLSSTKRGFARILPGARAEHILVTEPVGRGLGEIGGSLISSLTQSAIAILFPPVAPAVVLHFGLAAGRDELDESGSIAAAVGVGLIEMLSECLGLTLISGKINKAILTSVGRAAIRGDTTTTVSILKGLIAKPTLFAEAAAIEGVEELAALYGQEAWRAGVGVQTWPQAFNNMYANTPMTFGMGVFGGALLGGIGYAGRRFSPNAAADHPKVIEAQVSELEQAIVELERIREDFKVAIAEEQSAEVAPEPGQTPSVVVPAVEGPPKTVAEAVTAEQLAAAQDDIAKRTEAAKEGIVDIIDKVIEKNTAAAQEERMEESDLISLNEAKSLLEGTVEEVAEKETKTPATRLATIQKTLRKFNIIPPAGKKVVTLAQALKASLQRQEAAARTAAFQTERRMRAEFKQKMLQVQQKVAERLRLEKDKAKRLRALKTEIISFVKKNLPTKVQGLMIRNIEAVKTESGLQVAIELAQRILDVSVFKTAVKALRAEGKRIRTLTGKRRITDKELSNIANTLLEEEAAIKLTDIDRVGVDGVVDLTNQLQLIGALNKAQFAARTKAKSERLDSNAKDIANEWGSEDSPLSIESTRDKQRHFFSNVGNAIYGPVGVMFGEDLMSYLAGGEIDSVTAEVFHRRLTDAAARFFEAQKNISDRLLEVASQNGISEQELLDFTDAVRGTKNRVLNFANPRAGLTEAKTIPFRLESGKVIDITLDQIARLVNMGKTQRFLVDLAVGKVTLSFERKAKRDVQVVWTKEDHARLMELAKQNQGIQNLTAWTLGIYNGEFREALDNYSIAERNRRETLDDGEVYVPLPRKDEEAKKAVGEGLANVFAERAIEGVGLRKQRVRKTKAAYIVRGEIEAFLDYSHDLFGLVHIAAPVRDATTILNRLRPVMRKSKVGDLVERRLRTLLDAMAVMVVGRKAGLFDRASSTLINNMSRAVLGLNARVILIQPVAILSMAVFIPMEHIVATAIGTPADLPRTNAILGSDPLIGQRMRGSGINLVNEAAEIGISMAPKDLAMLGIIVVDSATISWAYRASERWMRQKLGPEASQAEVEKQALAITSRVTLATQSATVVPTFASQLGIEAILNPNLRFVNFMRSQVSKNLSGMYSAAIKAKNGQISFAELARRLFLFGAGQAISMQIIRELWAFALRGFDLPDPDEEEARPLLYMLKVTENLTGNWLYGDAITGLFAKIIDPSLPAFPPDVFPPLGAFNQGFHSTINMSSRINKIGFGNSISDARFWKHTVNLGVAIGELFGVPVGPIFRDSKRIYEGLVEDIPVPQGRGGRLR